jgi:hypothetical protein
VPDKAFHPLHVVLAYKLAELVVGFAFLHGKHFLHVAGNILQFQFPVHECTVNVHPVLHGEGVVDLHGQAPETLLVGRLRGLAYDFTAMNVLL